MRRFPKRLPVPVLAVLMLAAGLAPARAVTSPVALPSLVPSWAVPSARIGAADPHEEVRVELILPWRDPAAVASLARAVSDPASPSYGRHLTSDEFRARYAPTAATVASLTAWLRANGLQLGRIPANRIVIPARGTAVQVQRAFGVTLSRYRVRGMALRAPDAAPRLPAQLARLGILIRGLDEASALLQPSVIADDPPAVPETPANPADAAPPAAVVYANPCSAYDGATVDRKAPPMFGRRNPAVRCGLSVDGLRAAYGVDALLKKKIDGRGQTIVMVGSHSIRNLPGDIAEWSRRRKIPVLADGQFRQFSYPGAYETPADPTGSFLRPHVWAVQAAMLFQTMRAIAPGAGYRYIGSTSSMDLQNALLLAVDQHYGDVIVNGWYAAGEALVTPSDTAPIDRAAEQAAATGISVLFASGDLGDNAYFNATQTGELGVAEGDTSVTVARNVPVIPGHPSPSFPAHNSMVTAVGATSLIAGRGDAYVREVGWAKSHRTLTDGRWSHPDPGWFRGSGGGRSVVYRQPDYQAAIVPDALAQAGDGTLGRTVPDIAVNGDAETGMLIGYTQTFPDGSVKYSERRANANTASAALFGAMIALVNQRRGAPLGFVNPALYALGKKKLASFRDIVVAGGFKADVRRQYVNASDPSKGVTTVLKTFQEFGSNPPRPGYDTNTGLGSPSKTFLLSL